jgi:hypothetical protein
LLFVVVSTLSAIEFECCRQHADADPVATFQPMLDLVQELVAIGVRFASDKNES